MSLHYICMWLVRLLSSSSFFFGLREPVHANKNAVTPLPRANKRKTNHGPFLFASGHSLPTGHHALCMRAFLFVSLRSGVVCCVNASVALRLCVKQVGIDRSYSPSASQHLIQAKATIYRHASYYESVSMKGNMPKQTPR